jgi:hypothetical protein
MINEFDKNFLESELDKLEADFIKRINLFLKGGLRNIDLVQLYAELNLFEELNESGLNKVVDKLKSEYAGIVENIIGKVEQKGLGISGLSVDELETIINLRADELLGRANAYALEFKSGLLQGFASGLTDDEIISKLQSNIPLKSNQLIAAVNTARSEFQATSVLKLFEDNPDTRFKMNHIIDDRTRCQCKAVALYQPKAGFTRAEIDAGAWTKIAEQHCPSYAKSLGEGKAQPYNLVNRGGFNCRGVINIV